MGDDDHVSLDELAAWYLGMRHLARHQVIAEHLGGGCERCAADLEWVRRTLQLVRSRRLTAPPPEVLQRAIAIWKRQVERTRAAAVRRLMGRLVFDSSSSPQPVGMRGSANAGRQLLYAIDDLEFDIDLRVELDLPEQRCHLTGQLLSSRVDGGELLPSSAVVEAADGTRTQGELHVTGEITASYPKDGPCTLLLWIGDSQLALPILEP